MNKYIRLFNTVKYLKIKQIYFRLFYLIRNKYRQKIGFKYPIFKNEYINNLRLDKSIINYTSYSSNSFKFLNLSKEFKNGIGWNFNEFGKLWTYNLVYFDFINQKNIDENDGILLIHDFIKNDNILIDAKEPFPISLRGINWIKFLTKYSIVDSQINNILYSHYKILEDNLEYHLLGNHLLENGFSLLFASYYFEDDVFYSKAKDILTLELNEQILEDGGHFELSPMYHQIMLFRVLDCINLVKNNEYKNKELLLFLEEKASFMLAWLKNITYLNGDIPLFNDSANSIAPSSKDIFKYANDLDIEIKSLELNESGYRKVIKEKYECIVDVGHVGAAYIPGHAHSDTFNFELQINKKHFIVDTGLSTYETNDRRTLERSTCSHNTVAVNSKNQSEVWGGFRVANRAKIINLKEEENYIESIHDGYKKEDVLHERKWIFEDDKIIIEDSLSKEAKSIAMLHFHPSISREEILKKVKVISSKFKIINFYYSPEFNIQLNSLAIKIEFVKKLKVEINI